MAQVTGSTAGKGKTASSYSSLGVPKGRRKRISGRPGGIGRITKKGRVSEPYEWELHKRLKDTSFASEYLTECLDDENPKVFLVALKHVIAVHGGMSRISQEAHLNRESLYKALSDRGNPSLRNVVSILSALGIKLSLREG